MSKESSACGSCRFCREGHYGQCIGGGGPYFSIGAYTGYFKANDNSYPKTGDTIYVHAVAAMTVV